jgi:hypothetical protein
MTVTDEKALAAEAQQILDNAPVTLPGLETETKVSILGATFATNEEFVLGERVVLRLSGYVTHVGDQLIEDEGKRGIVKVQATLIQVADKGDDLEE